MGEERGKKIWIEKEGEKISAERRKKDIFMYLKARGSVRGKRDRGGGGKERDVNSEVE